MVDRVNALAEDEAVARRALAEIAASTRGPGLPVVFSPIGESDAAAIADAWRWWQEQADRWLAEVSPVRSGR